MDELGAIREAVSRILHLAPDDLPACDYMISLVLANTISPDAEGTWGYLVGPPGSCKTELLRTLEGWSRIELVDEFSPNALASGYTSDEDDALEDPSFLPHLDGKVLVLKDFSSFQGQLASTVEKLMGTLRSAYDGTYAKVSGRVGIRRYEAKFGLLIATVPEIDMWLAETQKLGERFLMFRLGRFGARNLSRRETHLTHVYRSRGGKPQWRAALRQVTHRNLDAVRARCERCRQTLGTVLAGDKQVRRIVLLADLVGRLRTAPYRGQPAVAEVASRLVQQLANLASARALASGRQALNDSDLAFIRRVASDTLPRMAYQIYSALYLLGESDRITPVQLSEQTRIEVKELLPWLHQYAALDIVRGSGGDYWLAPDTVRQIHHAGLAPHWRSSGE